MKTTLIRQKLHHFIETGEDKKIKAIYTMLESEIEEDLVWTDEFLKAMKKRSHDFESGKVKGRSWEDVKKKIKLSNK